MQGKSISVLEAARIIYGRKPTAEQMAKVLHKLQRGELRGTRRLGRWATTTEDVADYLAKLTMHQEHQLAQRRAASLAPQRTKLAAEQSLRMHDAYQYVLRDYFLALIFRRRARKTTKYFQRAVLGGQVLCLALIAAVVVSAIRPLMPAEPAPEHRAIQSWIQNNVGTPTITRWFPPQANPQGAGKLVRVQFSYFRHGRKKIDSDLLFLLDQQQIVGVESR
jgi:hypothetical protein